MDCPVCKYPNPTGVTHCGMCYEVFNRSAAQNYMHALRKENKQDGGSFDDPDVMIKSQHYVQKSFLANIDWQAIARVSSEKLVLGMAALKKNWKWPVAVATLIVLWSVGGILLSGETWYHLLGKKFRYEFPAKTDVQYLIGLKQKIKMWSERQGRLDTPMQTLETDEMGNVLFRKTALKKKSIVQVSVREWIRMLHDNNGETSQEISKKHPSLTDARIILDAKGNVLERRLKASPRVGKTLPFLTPRFPKESLRVGQQWDESVEWLDVYDDWEIYWTGNLHWTLGEFTRCGRDSCAQFMNTLEARPELRRAPAWAKGITSRAQGKAIGQGEALFDAKHKRLYKHSVSYAGLLHLPVTKLERIPDSLRIGRRVKGPGEVLIRFENIIDVRKN